MAFKIGSTTVLGDTYSFTADKQYLSSPAGFIQIGGFQGLIAGYTAGGYTPSPSTTVNTIDRFPFSTPFTAATDVGDLSQVKQYSSGQSSSSHGYISGGYTGFVNLQQIDKYPFSTPFATSTSAGNINLLNGNAAYYTTGQSSETNGYVSGGYNAAFPGPNQYIGVNTIERFPFSASFTSATDVGDLSQARYSASGQSSQTYGYTSGGTSDFVTLTRIDRFPFSSPFTTAANMGSLSIADDGCTGVSSSTDGYSVGSAGGNNVIGKFPFNSPFTNSTDVGNLINSSLALAGTSSLDYGYISGESVPPTSGSNAVTRFPFTTPFTTATDVGDLSQGRRGGVGIQY
jgi:hypothetical protein